MTGQRLTLRQVVSEFCFFGDRVEALEAINKLIRAAYAEGLAEAAAQRDAALKVLADHDAAALADVARLIDERTNLKARVAALEKLLAKATMRIEILLGRMHGCDDETTHGVRHVDGHALSYIEGEGWIEEQRAALAEAARSALKSAVIAADPE